MNDMIKIPYLNLEIHIDEFFAPDTAMKNKQLLTEYADEFSPIQILTFACHKFRPIWNDLERKYGEHLYGLWDDCIELQIREWFGFPPPEYEINEDRRHIYFECRHRYCVES